MPEAVVCSELDEETVVTVEVSALVLKGELVGFSKCKIA
jgi:hypothetical protein